MMKPAAHHDGTNDAYPPAREECLTRTSGLLLHVVDAALLAVLFVAPLFLGGRHPVGRLVYVVLCVTMAVAWMVRQCLLPGARVVRCAGAWILVGAVLLVALQLMPLPASVLDFASSRYFKVLPLWHDTGPSSLQIGSWPYLSLTPEATRNGLVMLLAYGLLFLVTVQRIGELRDVGKILRWIALAAVGMASLGIVQYLFSNGKFLWVYEHPFRNTFGQAQGSFINRNHFAHVVALGIGPILFWLAVRLSRGNRRSGAIMGLAIALGLLAFAILLSLSRGGAIVAAIAALTCITVYAQASLMSKEMFVGCVGVAILVGAALAIHGHERVVRNLDDLASGSLEHLDRHRGRRAIWQANMHVFQDFPMVGAGVGSHREIHPMYRDGALDVEFTHAENGYLQVASETGIAGAALLASAIVVCGLWCWRTMRHSASPYLHACSGAVAAGLVASLVHSLFDFVWYIPACTAPTVVLAACANRLDRFARPQSNAVYWRPGWGRPGWCVFTSLTVAMGGWMIGDRVGPAAASRYWDRYLHSSVDASQDQLERLREAVGDVADGDSSAASVEASMGDTTRMIRHLEKVVYWHPAHARAHSRLAGLCLDHFAQRQRGAVNQMDVVQIRNAAMASRFSSRGELNTWLLRAFGENSRLLSKAQWHARRAVRHCPLQGESYWYLAQLSFLDGVPLEASSGYLDQALRVRPHEPNLLFAAGKEAALAGDLTSAVPYWKECFHSDVALRLQIIRLFAPQAPAQFFLDSFKPRLNDLMSLCRVYKSFPPVDGVQPLCDYSVKRAQQQSSLRCGAESARMWLSAARVCREMQRREQALECLRRACRLDGNNYTVRSNMSELLVDLGRYEEAQVHVRWCLRRRPGERGMQGRLERVIRAGLDRRPAAGRTDPATTRRATASAGAAPTVLDSGDGA